MKQKHFILIIIILSLALTTKAQQVDFSLYNDASRYYYGIGVPKDEQKAFSLYLLSATGGNAKAMNAVGVFYREGIGTQVNKAQSLIWFTKSAENGYAKAFYNIGNIYKDGIDNEMNLTKAFQYYSLGATLQDPQSVYAKGYMLYKGLGCKQNYSLAVNYFKQAASFQLPVSMYYLGLCFRNGYGIAVNTDSAKYWLQKALTKGEKMAFQELSTNQSENNNPQLAIFADSLKNKTITSKNETKINKAVQITNSVNADIIEGKYSGYIIKYDWSNRYAINKSALNVELLISNNTIVGSWIEEDSIKIPFQASLTVNNLMFFNTMYNRTGHYNPITPISYSFQNAKLKWKKINDSLVLSGEIQMFNNFSNEPQKPQYIYLTKYESSNNQQQINLLNDDGTQMKNITNLSAFPNPFNNIVNVEFKNKEPQSVQISLLNVEGKVIYTNDLGVLEQGAYSIVVKPNQSISAGIYFIKMKYSNKIKTVKIIKQ